MLTSKRAICTTPLLMGRCSVGFPQATVQFQKSFQFTQLSSLHSSARLFVRGRNENAEDGSQHEGRDETKFNGSEGTSSQGQQQQKSPFDDPNFVRRMRVYMLIVGGCTFVVSYVIMKPLFSQQFPTKLGADINAPPLEMEEFLNTYIPSGEVKRLVHFPKQEKAVAWLHDDAIINGQPANHSFVVVKYERVDGVPPEHFREEIRAKEKELGIPLQNAINVEEYYGFSNFRFVELLIGIAILGFLASQYGRLVARKIAEQKAKGGGR
ncbi:unnamed protein product [Anisakis simplex]|uniref:Uncharacterized protein n=1 Tax=Anisakis simplex TaxID=6269 RepID=A0A3P6NR14_ANISI|nr:unnamed protein product [Anisakis simplex]